MYVFLVSSPFESGVIILRNNKKARLELFRAHINCISSTAKHRIEYCLVVGGFGRRVRKICLI